MSLKILGGNLQGRTLKTPKGSKTRPTLAIMRKAVFDILQDKIQEAQFLDLYAGSGSMGFEALSRGAAHVTFIETDRGAFSCIEENMRNLQLQDQCTLLSYDALLALKKLARDSHLFDIVYADPPYAAGSKHNLLKTMLAFFDTHSMLNSRGKLFLEESSPPKLQEQTAELNQLRFVDSRTFSHSCLHQFELRSKT